MSYLTLRPGRPVAAAALSLLLVLAFAAPQARADGEDDPTFGNVGTAFVSLDGFAPLQDQDNDAPIRPRTDQAPDGAVITAVALHADPLGRSAPDTLRLVRMDPSGKPAGLDGDGVIDVTYSTIWRLLDVEALADGRILVVTQSFSSAGRGSTPLEIRRFDASGNESGDGEEFEVPDDCANSGADAVAADVTPAGVVFVGWHDCKGDAVLARYEGENELTRVMPVRFVNEVTLGPDDLVYVLSLDPTISKSARGFTTETVVTRYDTTSLDIDGDYGDEGVAEVPGRPVDMTVGPNGRAVVWAQPRRFLRGDESETWDFYGLDDDGELDPSWSEDGHAEITHPDLGDEGTGECYDRGRFCGSELPQVIAQSDNKIIAIGYPAPDEQQQEETPFRGQQRPSEETDRTIIRLTEGGALDWSWDGDGVRSFSLTQPSGGSAEYLSLGPPALQADGKLLIPLFTQSGQIVTRVPAPPDGIALGVSRIGLTPPAPPPPAQQVAASAVAVAQRSCVSRRVFRIRLRTGRRKAERSAIKTVTVTVNGKNVPVTKGQRRRAQVDLRNLPKGRFTVVIRMTLADGGKVRDTRRYRTCTPKQARELPALRTRKPRRR